MATDTKTQVRAGCYLRISSDPEDKKQGTQRQREDTATLCEKEGWTVAGIYPDDNRSASNGKDRPKWKQLLADIKAGEIDAIAAWDQDRNWRMMHELEDLRRFFDSLDREVQLATTGQGVIDLYSPTGVMMAQIKTAVSEHEIAMMRVRQRRAGRQRAESGRPKWKAAHGYVRDTRDKKLDDGTRKVDKAAQRRVTAAYRAVVKGGEAGKITGIAEKWNAAGVRGLNGEPWSASTLSLFLRSPRNAGLRDYHGEIVKDGKGDDLKGTWEPLVDVELWRAAQAVMNTPERLHPKKVRKHLLTGLLRCGRVDDKGERCLGTLGGQSVLAGPMAGPRGYVLTYTCKTCRGVAVRAADVEPLVLGLLTERLARPDAEKLLRSPVEDAKTAKLDAETKELRDRLNEIADERADGLIDGRGYARAAARIQEKIDAIARRQQCQHRLQVLEDLPLGTDKVGRAVERLTPDRLRAVVDVLMTVTVMPIGKGHKVFDRERVHYAWKQEL
jgi:DNA invertase Pin-like site-specific DNA recombinase